MKRTIALILCFMLLFSTAVFAESTEEKAKTLYDLGLLKGTSDTFSAETLELDRSATRAEVCVTIVRMLGKEEKAIYQKNPHPFTDVPEWAGDFVGWLYENYLVNGITDTYFAANDAAAVKQFLTMLLRVLGYDDSAGDFSYENAVEFGKNIGIADRSVKDGVLLRRDMIDMCYRTLTSNIKNSSRTLIAKLCDDGDIERERAVSSSLLREASLSDYFSDMTESLGGITVKRSGEAYVIKMDNDVEHFAVKVFVKKENEAAIREITEDGDEVYFEKGDIEYKYGGAAGYISEIFVYGLDMNEKYQFIVTKATKKSGVASAR